MTELKPLFSVGMGIITLCVLLMVGGMMFIGAYDASLATTGSYIVYTNYSVDTCNQDLPNESSSCGGLATGAIDNTTWTGITGDTFAFDKDWDTNSTDFINATEAVLEFNYSIPANTTSAILTAKYDNATGAATTTNITISGANCRNSTDLYAVAINVTANASYGVYCINDSGEYTLLDGIDMPNESFMFYEQEIWWSINKSHSNYTASTYTIVDSLYADAGTALVTFTSLIPLIALAVVGGIAIVLLMGMAGRKQA